MDNLFELDWQSEWQGMPEFVQNKQEPFAMVRVRFETQQDLEDFAKLIGQKLTPKTKSIWHPEKQRISKQRLRWRDAT